MTAGLGDPVSDTELAARFQRDPEMFTVVYDRYARDIFREWTGWVRRQPMTSRPRRFWWRSASGTGSTPAREPAAVAVRHRDNLVARHRRKEARHYMALARIGAEPPPEELENRVVSAVTAERLQPQLARALTRLSRGERDVILLVALSELSHEERSRHSASPMARSAPGSAVRARSSRA